MFRNIPEAGLSQRVIVRNCEIGPGLELGDFVVLDDCTIGDNCAIWRFANLYGCEIGDECMIGSLVEVQEDATIGDRCRVQSHAFVCSLVTIEDDVFVSHGAKFINDRYPPSSDANEWEETVVHAGASIGTNATLLPVDIGVDAVVGAGAVVTEDVPAKAIVAGNPAEIIGYRE